MTSTISRSSMQEEFTNNERLSLLIQTKGIEIQNKVESKIANALTQYNIALHKLRKSVFVEFKDLKKQVAKSKQDSENKREMEIQEIKKSLCEEIVNVHKVKQVFCQMKVNTDFPLVTRHYILKASNINVDVSSTYNLFNLCAFQTISKPIDPPSQKGLTRSLVKIQAEREIKDLDQHKVNFVCQYLTKQLSPHYTIMVILAKIINKPPTSLSKFWFQLTKPSPSKNKQQKVFAYKNAQYFCSICRKYVCNIHYVEAAGDDAFGAKDTEPDYEFHPYSTRFLAAYSKDDKEREKIPSKKSKDEELKASYSSLYKCPPKIQNNCYLKAKKNIEQCNKEFIVSMFQRYESEFILNYCLKYGITNPCVISLMLKGERRCWEIRAFLERHSNYPRNVYPAELIEKAKTDKKIDLKQKKKKNEPTVHVWKRYVPCYHPGEPCNDNCLCQDLGFCELYCGCPKDCPIKFPGCNCKPGKCAENSNCFCFQNNRECDPELCKSCNSSINCRLALKKNIETTICHNTKIYYKYKARLLLGKSTVCEGLGIFAGQTFEKGEFIGEYVGEMIDYLEGDLRGVLYNMLGCSYMFDYEEDTTLDSYFYGNKLRFVNHGYGGAENSETKYKFVKGTVHIGLYASKSIKVGQEILFNYGENYQLEWLLEYNAKVRKQKKEEENKRKKLKKKKAEKIDLFQGNNQLNEDMIFSDLEDS